MPALSPHTDLIAGGWVSRLPSRLRPYALLARLDRPIGIWLLFLPGLWSIALVSSAAEVARLALLFLVGAVLMRAAGCTINDMWDRDLDRRVARTVSRPLAAGDISLRGAALFLATLLTASLLILLQLNTLSRLLGAASLLLVATYPLAKRITWWPQLMLGCTFGWGAPMGYAAACGRLDLIAVLLYGAAICWILGYDTIYAHQDRQDDARIGVRSTARLFADHSRPMLACCYAGTIALLAAAGAVASLHTWFWVLLAAAAGLLIRQVVLLDIHDPAGCLKLFKANRDVGLLIALALAVGRW